MLRRVLLATTLIAFVGAIVGCGGGSGGGGGGIMLSGVVSAPSTRAAQTGRAVTGTTVAGATINAYIWSNTTQSIAHTVTDSSGHYSITLPGSASGKDIVLIATTSGSPPQRLSTIVSDLPASGNATADLNAATTIAAEVLANAALKSDPPADITSSEMATIEKEVSNWSGINLVDLTVPGTILSNNFGGGLQSGNSADNFVVGDATIQDELSSMSGASGSTDIQQARQMVQFLRDTTSGLTVTGKSELLSLTNALSAQDQLLASEMPVLGNFSQRMDFVANMLGIVRHSWQPSLTGQAPGQYVLQVSSSGSETLQQNGASPDGKSWIVTSALNDSSNGMKLVLTPTNPLSAWALTPQAVLASGGLSLTVTQPSNSAVNTTGTLTEVTTTSGLPTQVSLDITVNDPALTSPITFNGKLSGTPATSPTGANPYSQLSFTGKLSTSLFTINLGGLTASFSSTTQDLQSIQLSNFSTTVGTTNPITLSMGSATVSFEAADPANGFPTSTPLEATFSGSLSGFGGRQLSVNHVDLTFARVSGSSSSGNPVNRVVPKKFTGTLNYSSSVFTFTGTASGVWNNPSVISGSSPSLTQFPLGSVSFVGNMQPAVGDPFSVDMALNSATTSSTAKLTLDVNKIAFGSGSLSGAATKTFGVSNGTVQTNPASFALQLTYQPSGLQLNLSNSGGASSTITGTISASSGTKLADIGPANQLGLPDLGNQYIIKYTDGTFETAVSILP